MGVVYKARQVTLNRPVALKMIKAGMLADDAELRRFQNEAEAVALLDHPGIVPVYEVGQHEGQRYFSMKLIEGGNLAEQLASLKDNPKAAATLLAETAEAVHHAHMRGVLHRDLKPANILIDAKGHPHITDFGLAKRIESNVELTQSGAIMGTPAYMSPEQAAGRRGTITTASDVYGLGAVLYTLLTGHAPFRGDLMVETLEEVRERAPEPPSKRNPCVPHDLEVICLKCLEKDPARRYASAQSLADDLRRFVDNEPILARPVGAVTRAWFWCKRKPAIAGLVTTLVATVIVGIVGIWTEKLRRNEAEVQRQLALARQAVNFVSPQIGFTDDRPDPLQQEFLSGALEYYEEFASRVSHDPVVRIEYGQVYQQMGDIRRKLGKFPESEQAYRKAIEILEPLAGNAGAGPDPKRTLARIRTLLGDLLVRRGVDKVQIDTLYRQALKDQQLLFDAKDATSDDRLHLGQTLRSQGDLLRLNGQFTPAKPIYDRALGVLEEALTADPKRAEILNELALAADARGWINRELGEIKAAPLDYRRSLDLLDRLVAEFPTAPHYRESLANLCNSLGLLEETTGSLVEAEAFYRRELPLVERLSQDFPDRPEHGRELARTLSNLGNVLARNRDAGAEGVLQRAVDLNGPLTIKHPEDVQIRFDLAKDYQCLGDLQFEQGKFDLALESIRESRSRSEALVKEFPDKPRYSEALATNLADLGRVLHALNNPQSEVSFQESAAIYEKLVAAHPDNFDFKIGQAQCLSDQGTVIASLGHAQKAEAIYRKALALFDAKTAKAQTTESIRIQAGLLNNLGDLHLPGAEKAFGDSIALSTRLLAHPSPANKDLHNLAIAQNNLADLLVTEKRLADAEPLFAQSVANFEKLVASAPKAIDFQSHFGIVLALQGKVLAQTGKTAEGRAALESAVDHQRQAVDLSKSGNAPFRQLLGAHQIDLADVNLKLSAYDQAARVALEIPTTVPNSSRAEGCLDAARLLARLVTRLSADQKIAQAKRDRLARGYLARIVVLLREVIDTDPRLAEQIKTDHHIKLLKSRPDFQTMMDLML